MVSNTHFYKKKQSDAEWSYMMCYHLHCPSPQVTSCLWGYATPDNPFFTSVVNDSKSWPFIVFHTTGDSRSKKAFQMTRCVFSRIFSKFETLVAICLYIYIHVYMFLKKYIFTQIRQYTNIYIYIDINTNIYLWNPTSSFWDRGSLWRSKSHFGGG